MEASGLVAALEAAWSAIQDRHPEVPDVVVTLGAGSIGVPAGALKLGHFAARRWVTSQADPSGMSASMAELFVGGEGLGQGAESVLKTLLHEAAHGLADVRGIQDTSRQGRYHNKRFKTLGEEMGLVITQTEPIGWSGTELAPGTASEYAEELDELALALTAYRHIEGQLPADPNADPDDDGSGGEAGADGKTGRRPKNGLVLHCGCPKPRKIRASGAVVELGPILCGVCRQEFTPAS